jgi:hypothetical protein
MSCTLRREYHEPTMLSIIRDLRLLHSFAHDQLSPRLIAPLSGHGFELYFESIHEVSSYQLRSQIPGNVVQLKV